MRPRLSLLRILLRRHRLGLAAWWLLLTVLCGVTVSAYQSTYPTPEQRAAAAALMRDDPATTLAYGHLADPGGPASMFVWEAGAIVTVLAAVLAVVVATSLTRGGEDDGTLELVRSCGLDARAPLRAAMLVVLVVAAALAAGAAAVLGVQSGAVDGVTWSGSAVFGAVVGLTFALVATLTAVVAQVCPTTGTTHAAAFAAVGVAFGLRAWADTRDLEWMSWLSPLGLRATVRPFGDDRWWAVAAYAAVAAALARLATALAGRREYGAGLVHRIDRADARLEIRSSLGLSARLSRSTVVSWTVGVAVLGALFATMGSGAVEQSRRGDLDGFLGSQLGDGDPTAGYLGYVGTLIGIVVSAFAVVAVRRARHDEAGGLTDLVLAAGERRPLPLASQLAVAAGAALLVLLTTGALVALVAPGALAGPHVAAHAFTAVVGQWPAALALAGWTALLAGRWPRATWLAWVPLVAGALLALLGDLLDVPRRVQDAGLFELVPGATLTRADVPGLVVLLAVAGATGALGVRGFVTRDVGTG
jgi:ABC-2 type transport system permease protein